MKKRLMTLILSFTLILGTLGFNQAEAGTCEAQNAETSTYNYTTDDDGLMADDAYRDSEMETYTFNDLIYLLQSIYELLLGDYYGDPSWEDAWDDDYDDSTDYDDWMTDDSVDWDEWNDSEDYDDWDDWDDSEDWYDYDYQEDQLAVFHVKDGKLIVLSGDISAVDLAAYTKIWDRIKTIVPDHMENLIVKFDLTTDGVDGGMAYVVNEDDGLREWTISIDPKDAFNEDGSFHKELDHTIIHEFAHILTLNHAQMENVQGNGTYENEEGDLAVASYLNLFYQKFWKPIIMEHTKMVERNPEEGSYDFYDKYQNQFVSDYAATNPEEDIAETFTHFVLHGKPEGKTISDQKIQFMYQFEELVKMRAAIRTNLGL